MVTLYSRSARPSALLGLINGSQTIECAGADILPGTGGFER